ncbi:MAG: ATP synthase F1 subunit delta [Spirochaetota bacterium]
MAGKEVSKIYAGALLDISVENNILPRIGEELESIVGIISSEKDFMLFLNAPIISKDKKKQLIDKLFRDKVSQDIIIFLKVLIDNDRQSYIVDIYKNFVDLMDQINNRQKIKVITSVKLENATLKRIEEAISRKLKKTIIVEEEVNKSILGGIIIRIDDMLIDGSIVKDLNIMRAKLIETKVGGSTVYED